MSPRTFALSVAALCVLRASTTYAAIFGSIKGLVHDPQHRPIAGAHVGVRAAHSSFTISTRTDSEGAFTLPSLPLGDYFVDAAAPGFATSTQPLTLASGTVPLLHFQLQIGVASQTVLVTPDTGASTADSVTPTTLISRSDIAQTPGATRTNSLAIITDFVPGAYITHDMLHMRGGHQVSWLLDGVQIPNTNIAGNLAAQIDPKDIDYLEVQRGSYTATEGDRTFGIFNIVPRSGFERDREAELILNAGSFFQTEAQLNAGDHTDRVAWYGSLTANRSDLGLSPPIAEVHHDQTHSVAGFASLLYNRTPKDQFRVLAQLRSDFFQIPLDPDPQSAENQQFDSSGLRDAQHESDALTAVTWLHTFSPSAVLQVSPFFHRNRAAYDPSPTDSPEATTSTRASTYGGLQSSLTLSTNRNLLQGGLYSFGQHDTDTLGVAFNNNSSVPSFLATGTASGGLVEVFVSDTFKATSWLTFIGGVRQSRFAGQITETATAPRVGLSLRVPRLNWVLRGFYGRFYQPPPLLTASGPVLQFAQANNTDFAPLHGERDEEHQFGLQIPFRGWLLDAGNFRTHISNFLDHANIGDSSIYYPVTVQGALVRAWELSLRSPRLAHFGQVHLAYSNQIAEQRGPITGGLICAPIASPQCDIDPGFHPVDHDQRNTLSAGFSATLPSHISASANVAYGSGFTNGNPDASTPYPNAYLPAHTTLDVSVARTFSPALSASVTATNLNNQRVLLDNSLTFGGFHFSDPRTFYGEVRFRFKY